MRFVASCTGAVLGGLFGFFGLPYVRGVLLRLFWTGYDPAWDLGGIYYVSASGVCGALLGGVLGCGLSHGWFSPLRRRWPRFAAALTVSVALLLLIHVAPFVIPF
jgi:hypothetical protein